MKKILTVLGARPQFIKSKPLSDILRHQRQFKEVIVHTGQHYDFSMYDIFLKELNLPRPNYFLGVNEGDNLSQVSRMLVKLKLVFNKESPDLVLVYGDTNSTLAGALAAKEHHLPLAHVEAGLRSFRLDMVEELNRVITDRISYLLFAPVKEAVINLRKEGIAKNVFLVGDVLYDVLLKHNAVIDNHFKEMKVNFRILEDKYFFMTLHRAETVDNRSYLKLILKHVNDLDCKIVFPMHPRTKKQIKKFGMEKLLKNIHCVIPQSYLRTLSLIKHAKVVLTDSGGVQRESYLLKTPCITLRNETEWNQTLKYGWNRLLSANSDSLVNLNSILEEVRRPNRYENIFGNGDASIKIVKIIENILR